MAWIDAAHADLWQVRGGAECSDKIRPAIATFNNYHLFRWDGVHILKEAGCLRAGW